MARIAVVGDLDTVIGFRGLGMRTVAVRTKEEALTEIHRLKKADYALIYLTETLARDLEQELEEIYHSFLPALILIPAASGKTGFAQNKLRTLVRKAVGIDLLKDEASGNEDIR